jgi:glycosyltransferase involved in cell wall biosynthesis
MILIIEAASIKAGGGLTHLLQLINNHFFKTDRFSKIYLLSSLDFTEKIKNENITSVRVPLSISNRIRYTLQPHSLLKFLKEAEEDLFIFAPGGTFFSRKHKYVSMSQNMLVFEKKERNRFPFSISRFRYNLLQMLQRRSFKNASGNIFVSNYAYEFIGKLYPKTKLVPSEIIYHGISERFKMAPRVQKNIEEYTLKNPFNILYVSIINYYKHQDNVIKAVKKLRDQNIPVHLHLAGPINPSLQRSFEKDLEEAAHFVTYHGAIPYDKAHFIYKETDAFLFASTCENMPNILIEAMSAGLPILCSSYGPMPEILKDGGLYCDPTDPEDIASQLRKLLFDKEFRRSLAETSYNISQQFSWDRCATETSRFLEKIAFE